MSMRQNRANSCGDRSNALWGRGSRGEHRSNALWGRGGRRAGAVVTMVTTAFVMAAGATAAGVGTSGGSGGTSLDLKAYVQDTLVSAVQQNPKQTFDVIVQGNPDGKTSGFLAKVLSDTSGSSDERLSAADVKHQFNAITGFQASLSGKTIVHLAKQGLVSSIIPNETVKTSGVVLPNYNLQLWPFTTGAAVDWTNASLPKLPAIAVVDSGIEAGRPEFTNRVLGQVNLASLSPNKASGDGYGHGTFVAGVAAASGAGTAGVAPKANLLSVDVMNDQGMSTVSDVVRACDWILANKTLYNIRVANFSLHAANRASVLFDPLDRAVEKLWLNGIVVVTASGNYATDGAQSGVSFAPGNDPFVITVGAADMKNTVTASDDVAAPWSAWGYTPDGFSKPELAAPGRYIVGPVPADSTLPATRADDVIAPGYMQLSGTSFSAPMVAGAAAMLLNNNPTWTPDMVKGALMMTASRTAAIPRSLGVGELNIPAARKLNGGSAIPNPNVALNRFVTTTLTGTKVFDAAAWQTAAWADAAWADNGEDDTGVVPLATPTEVDSILSDLGIVDPNCDPTLSECSATQSLLP
jgi:serine protease AprX